MKATTHEFLPEEVMAFLDGELSPDRAAAISAHLETCPECSARATDVGGLSQRMSNWQVGPFPARLAARVTAAVKDGAKGESVLDSIWKQRRSPVLKWAVGIASGFAVLLLLLTISTPRLLRSKMASNEAIAVGSLRTLNTAAGTYFSTYGHYPPSLESFGPSPSGTATENGAGLVDPLLAGGRKSGYLFTYHAIPPHGRNRRGDYTIDADPTEPASTGVRHFSTDQSGVIRMDGGVLDAGLPEKLQEQGQRSTEEQGVVQGSSYSAPLIARTAELKLAVEKLDEARERMDRILAEHKGYVAQLSASAEPGSTRTVTASLRVPADQLDACVAELKKLGRVTQESQAGEEVTQQHRDLLARLKNSRNTEARLNDVLHQHAGQVKDILDVEKESARVRGEIEQMEAEQQTLEHRVDFATIDLKLAEEYKAQLSSPAPSVGTQLRNATINGFRSAFESLMALLLFLAESGPTLLLWLAVLFFPGRLLWRRYQRAHAVSSSLGT